MYGLLIYLVQNMFWFLMAFLRTRNADPTRSEGNTILCLSEPRSFSLYWWLLMLDLNEIHLSREKRLWHILSLKNQCQTRPFTYFYATNRHRSATFTSIIWIQRMETQISAIRDLHAVSINQSILKVWPLHSFSEFKLLKHESQSFSVGPHQTR